MDALGLDVARGHVVQVAGSAGDCPAGDAVTVLSRAFVHTHHFAGVPAVYARVRAGGAESGDPAPEPLPC